MTIFEKLYNRYKYDKGTLRVRTLYDIDKSSAKQYKYPFTDEDVDVLLDNSIDKIFLNHSNLQKIPKVHDNVLLLDISEMDVDGEGVDGGGVDGEKVNGEFFGKGILAIDMSISYFPSFKNVTFPPNLVYLDVSGTVFGEVENITLPTTHTVYVDCDTEQLTYLYKYLGKNVEIEFDREKIFEEICNKISAKDTIDNQ